MSHDLKSEKMLGPAWTGESVSIHQGLLMRGRVSGKLSIFKHVAILLDFGGTVSKETGGLPPPRLCLTLKWMAYFYYVYHWPVYCSSYQRPLTPVNQLANHTVLMWWEPDPVNSAMQILTDGIKVLSTPAEPVLPVGGADWSSPGRPSAEQKGGLWWSVSRFCCWFLAIFGLIGHWSLFVDSYEVTASPSVVLLSTTAQITVKDF